MAEAQAAKHQAHLSILDKLEQQAREVERMTRGLTNEQLAQRVEEGKWSLRELVAHLSRLQPVFTGRVKAMLEQELPLITPYMPEDDPDFEAFAARPGDVVVREFLDGRREFVAWMRTLAPAQWHRAGKHTEYASYDVHFAVEYMAHHEAHHLYQMFVRRNHFGPLPH